MDTRLLKVFQAVARRGGLAGASPDLHLTPSALSHRLKALETELGCRLFERSGRRMTLTQAGEQLLAAIEEPLDSLAAAAAGLRELGRWGQGRLRVGAPTPLCEELFSSIVTELRGEFSKLHVVVEAAELPHLTPSIRDRRIDLGVGVCAEPESGVEYVPLFEDELLWVLAPEHPWAEGRRLSKADLRREPMIAHPHAAPTARVIDRYFRGIGIDPTVSIQVGCLRTMKDLVRRGQGVGVLPPWSAQAELTAGTLVMRPLGARGLRRSWVLAHLPGRRFTLAEERFHALMARDASRLWRDRSAIPQPT